MRRFKFIGRVVVSGLRWARELADHVLLLLGVVLLTAGIAVGGVLLHRSAWFLGGFGGLLLLAILFEGAFRTWDDADRRAAAARAALANENTRDGVAHRLDRFRDEYEQLGAEVPGEQEGVGPIVTNEQAKWNLSVNHMSEQVSSELRRNAPGFVAYWRVDPPPRLAFQQFGEWAKARIEVDLDQLRHIAARLREGHDEP